MATLRRSKMRPLNSLTKQLGVTLSILRPYMNQERYLRCHISGQLLNWTKNKTAIIHLIGRGTHSSSNTYATVAMNAVNTFMLVAGKLKDQESGATEN